MARYDKEFKTKVQQRMLPPNNGVVSEIAKETGVSEATLYKWRSQAKANGYAAPSNKKAEQWSTKDKFSIVMETATLSEIELAKYCRYKGLFRSEEHTYELKSRGQLVCHLLLVKKKMKNKSMLK